jgi:hypothetical protein
MVVAALLTFCYRVSLSVRRAVSLFQQVLHRTTASPLQPRRRFTTVDTSGAALPVRSKHARRPAVSRLGIALSARTIRYAKCTHAQGRSSARDRLLVRPRLRCTAFRRNRRLALSRP